MDKPESEFYVHRRVCKLCSCEALRTIRRENPEASRKASAKWRAANRDLAAERKRQRHLADPEADNKKSRDYKKNNRLKINKQVRRRYASDPLCKLTRLLRGRITAALAGKSKKGVKTTELLGAPWVWVEAYLEEQFVPGMSWENHGPVWHIDHIRPIASFDLTIPEQQKMCFHWTNLQPLFALDNFQKSDKYGP